MEPWVGDQIARWDELANLALLSLPVSPVDPMALPWPVRDLLTDWAQRRGEQLKEARAKT